MFSWFRSRARSLSSIALVALLALSVWSAAPHPDDCHDATCDATTVHDPTGHRVGRVQVTGEQPFHCILCQWTRSVRSATATVTHLHTPGVETDVRPAVHVFRAQSQYSTARPPLRAPPLHS